MGLSGRPKEASPLRPARREGWPSLRAGRLRAGEKGGTPFGMGMDGWVLNKALLTVMSVALLDYRDINLYLLEKPGIKLNLLLLFTDFLTAF